MNKPPNPIKVVQASKAYPPHLGGIETVVQQLAEGLAARHSCDSRVIVCNDTWRTQHEQMNGVRIARSGTLANVSSFPISLIYAKHLLTETGDVLQMHEPFLLAPSVYLAFLHQARKRYKRLVVWWHSDIVRQQKWERLYGPLVQALLRNANAIIVATPNHVTSSSWLGPVSHKCHVIPFGVDPERFSESSEQQTRIAAIHAEFKKPIILFVGRLVYYKGAEYLVEAMRNIPEAHLVIVGQGPLRPNLERLAEGCPRNVSFFPFLTEAEMVAMYKACQVFVLPSVEKSEAFGIVQLEAMACGKPVISTDLPTGVSYVNQDGVTGLTVPRRDSLSLARAIQKMVSDPGLCRHLGEAARTRVLREFTVNGMVDQAFALYQSILTS